MNTATQLLERCKAEIITNSKNSAGQYSVETSLLLSDIEAYLAKQQVEQEPVVGIK